MLNYAVSYYQEIAGLLLSPLLVYRPTMNGKPRKSIDTSLGGSPALVVKGEYL